MQKLNLKFRKDCRRKILPLIRRRLDFPVQLDGRNSRINEIGLFLRLEPFAYKLIRLLSIASVNPARHNGAPARRRVLDQ